MKLKNTIHTRWLAGRIMPALFMGLILTGCSKDFLETAPTIQLSEVDVYKTTETTRGVLRGVYRQWRSWSTGAGPNRMDCSGLQSMALVRETMGPDAQVTKSWYSAEVAYSVYTQDSYRTLYGWWLLYGAINNINNVLAYIDQAQGTQADKDRIRGEALAMRAFSYFELVSTYAPSYLVGKDKMGVVIYTEPTSAATSGNPRSTVEEVYSMILSDLNEAVGLIGSARTSKEYMNINVVHGLLARVYLTIGNYAEAATHAHEARQGFPLMDNAAWTSGFSNSSNAEWIWAQVNTELENPDWGSAVASLDTEHGGAEASFKVSNALYDLYSDDDVRRSVLFQDANNRWSSRKFTIGNPIYTADFPYMRSSEMYLIEAEALARAGGNEEDAADLLSAVQQSRDPGATPSGNTGQALIDEIITEKRKEFWGEGIYFRDMLRTSMPLVRDPQHNTQLSIPANSWQFIMQIPEREIIINTSVGPEDQNPSSGIIN